MDATIWVMCKNEEFWIGHVIASVMAAGANRIIIADTGSTDATLDILHEVIGNDGRVTFLDWVGGDATPETVTATRQRMADATTTEFGMIVDADELYYPDRLREVLESEMPPDTNLGYTLLGCVRWHDGAFWTAEQFNKEAFFRVEGMHWERGYPFEISFRDGKPGDGPKHHFGFPIHGLHLHNLRRSSRDSETIHRGDMPTNEPLVARLEMPFDLMRWPNPYQNGDAPNESEKPIVTFCGEVGRT